MEMHENGHQLLKGCGVTLLSVSQCLVFVLFHFSFVMLAQKKRRNYNLVLFSVSTSIKRYISQKTVSIIRSGIFDAQITAWNIVSMKLVVFN